MREELVGEMAVKHDPSPSEYPQKRDACRELVDKIDVVARPVRQQTQREVQLARVRKEDVQLALPRAREGGHYVAHAQAACARQNRVGGGGSISGRSRMFAAVAPSFVSSKQWSGSWCEV
jgi:hypothetical protein